jgi:uncharacterized iron-regulated membrane protein
MPGETMLAVVDGDAGELAAWLADEGELRGCVRRVAAPVPMGVLGADLAQLAVSLTSGGAATALASAVIAWLKRRAGPVTVRVSRDGSMIDLSVSRVREMSAEDLQKQVDQLASMVWPGDDVTADPGSGGDAED